MGKAAVAAAGSVMTGVGAFAALASLLPVAWAEGAALLLTGGALIAASWVVEGRKALPSSTTSALPAIAPVQRPQEA